MATNKIRVSTSQKSDANGMGYTSYTISGLTFGQIFRIKQAMVHESERLRDIIDNDLRGHEGMQEDFEEFYMDAMEVFKAICDSGKVI